MNILFLCTGNISRSYLAETLFKYELEQNHIKGIDVSSAGILDNNDMPADSQMVNYLKTMNIPVKDHLSKKITLDDVEWSDLILVMENRHRDYIHERWPEADLKVERLGRYISHDQIEEDIIDPYGKTLYHYRVVQTQIGMAVKALFNKLVIMTDLPCSN
jgi:protein-tyrosine-phosphatase